MRQKLLFLSVALVTAVTPYHRDEPNHSEVGDVNYLQYYTALRGLLKSKSMYDEH